MKPTKQQMLDYLDVLEIETRRVLQEIVETGTTASTQDAIDLITIAVAERMTLRPKTEDIRRHVTNLFADNFEDHLGPDPLATLAELKRSM